jgi:CRISPR/Cas system-associated exonuclease Cas4 (RecB family)
MNRPIVKAHTIAEWEALDPQTQSTILQNIRLRGRLEEWMKKQFGRPALKEPVNEPCYRCMGSGEVTHYPRLSGIHPSQVNSPCMLKIYYQMIGEEGKGKFDFRLQLIFALGTQIHLMFQGYGRKGAWGSWYKDEVRISEEYQEIAHKLFLEGSADAENILVIEDVEGPIYEVGIIHEYKSINDAGFKKLAGPKPEHKMQAIVYAKALDRPIVVYLYMDKNDSTLTDFPVPFNRTMWNQMEEKFIRLNQFYDAHDPPPGTTGYHCRECEFFYLCPEHKGVV